MSVQINKLKKLDPPKLAELVAQQLSELVASQGLRPGSQLPSEQELGDQFEVARSVIREALVRLRALGIIEVRQGKGAFVATLPLELLLTRVQRLTQTTEELLPHVWEIREILETSIAELAAVRRTENDLANLEKAISAMTNAIARGELGVTEDAVFHHYLTHAAYNPALEQIIVGISALIESSREHSLGRPNRPRSSNEEHVAILRAVRNREGELAKEAMREHLANGRYLTTGKE